MFKILIVDDEKMHRNGLMKLLYTIYPEDMLLEADSGEQALEIMKLLECDVVITDIRMPGMDGLELLRSIRKNFEETAVIILSGYGEFDYAREALKYGASDYLLKPVEPSEVKKCLDQVRNEITEQRTRDQTRESMKTQLRETEIIYVEHLMQQFIRNEDFDKKERIKEIFPLEHSGYLFLCDVDMNSDRVLDVPEFRLAMKKYIQSASSYSFAVNHKNLYAVLVMSEVKGDRTFFEGLQRILQKNLPGFRFSFYVSSSHENLYEEGKKAYDEAELLWKYRFYEPGDYCDYDLLKNRLGGELIRFSEPVGMIAEHVKQNDIITAFQYIKDYVREASAVHYPDPARLCRAVMLLLFQIVKALDAMMSDEMKQKTDEALTNIYQSDTVSILLRSVYSFLLEIGKNINFQKEIKGVDVLEHCRDYLDKHYMEEITLDLIAEKYYFNASYFSTIFKNYFGKSFSNYLIEIRMKKAKELLVCSDEKIKEITNKVGYNDANYFIRAFKKFYGYTPEEYRRMKAKD